MSKLKSEQIILLILVGIILLTGVGILIWQNINNETIIADLNEPAGINSEPELVKNKDQEREEKKEAKKIIIHVAGEVKNPGVFKLPEDSRVIDALIAAGGETETADLNRINLAAFIYDGEKIFIPSLEEMKEGIDFSKIGAQGEISGETGDYFNDSGSNKININRATVEELQTLTGIGPCKAKTIFEYRKKIGRFSDLNQLLNISGIGEKTLEKIKDKLTLR